MNIYAELIDMADKKYDFTNCISFYFVKEVYTPYTLFEGTFVMPSTVPHDINRVAFYIDNKNIHFGIVDSIDFYKEKGNAYIRIKSKSFTSLLCQNQPVPGMNPNVTLSDVMSGFSIPYVTYESTGTVKYIYVKEGSTLWDAAANFNFKLNGGYPYIEGTNTLRVTLKTPDEINIADELVTRTGTLYDYTKLISHLHMKDAEGTYDVFSRSNEYVINHKIVRHKQIPLDMQYLNDPDAGLLFKLNYSMRGCNCRYVEYVGYSGEDLNDNLTSTAGGISSERIRKLVISGRNSIIRTTLGVYTDDAF